MKQLFITVLFFILWSCSNKKNQSEANTSDQNNTKNLTTIAPEFQKGADLIANSDCLACHKVNEKVVGPSYNDVAAKYTIADIDMLAATIINGGVGHWGEIPMTPHPDLKTDDAKEMVKYILSLKQ